MKYIIMIILSISSSISLNVFAGRGCCSRHGGQAYCGSNGMRICSDGTQSPSCSCGGSNYYPVYTTYTPPTDRDAVCAKKYKGTHYRASDAMCVCPNGKPQDSKTKSCDAPKVEVKKEMKPKIDMTYYKTDKNKHCELNRPGTIYFSNTDECKCPNGEYYNNSCIPQKEQGKDADKLLNDLFGDTNKVKTKKKIQEKKSGKICTTKGGKTIKHKQKVEGIFELYNKDEEMCGDFLAIMKCNDGNFEITDNQSYGKCSDFISNQKLACELPRGGLIEDGQRIKVYKDYLEKTQCYSEYRTCNNGKLEGDSNYKYKKCVIDENLLED